MKNCKVAGSMPAIPTRRTEDLGGTLVFRSPLHTCEQVLQTMPHRRHLLAAHPWRGAIE